MARHAACPRQLPSPNGRDGVHPRARAAGHRSPDRHRWLPRHRLDVQVAPQEPVREAVRVGRAHQTPDRVRTSDDDGRPWGGAHRGRSGRRTCAGAAGVDDQVERKRIDDGCPKRAHDGLCERDRRTGAELSPVGRVAPGGGVVAGCGTAPDPTWTPPGLVDTVNIGHPRYTTRSHGYPAPVGGPATGSGAPRRPTYGGHHLPAVKPQRTGERVRPHAFPNSRRRADRAAQYPDMPWTPPPGGVDDEQR